MNKEEFALQWMAALLSGDYDQACGFLRRDRYNSKDGFCCLGVACDLYSQLTGKGKWLNFSYRKLFSLYGQNQGTFPPIEMESDIGLTSNNSRRLANMNDRGESFKTIAQEIERMQFSGDYYAKTESS